MDRVQNNSGLRSPEDQNNLLGVTSHKTRRLRGDLINMFKYIKKDQLFTLCQNRRTRGNDKNLVRPNRWKGVVVKNDLWCHVGLSFVGCE